MSTISAAYHGAGTRTLLLDYDGTLVPFATPPSGAHPDALLLDDLSKLSADPRTSVAIISGRDRSLLDQWFTGIPVRLVAEHGGFVRRNGAWAALVDIETSWIDAIADAMAEIVEECPSSLVERKTLSVAWHCRAADAQETDHYTRQLVNILEKIVDTSRLQIMRGDHIVEVRDTSVHKGLAVRELLRDDTSEFVLAIGDDRADEDMFLALPSKAYSVKIGTGPSAATYRLRSWRSARLLLSMLRSNAAQSTG